MFKLQTPFALVLFVAAAVKAQESHTVVFQNNCGFGTPTLVSQTGSILSTGGSFTSNGPLPGLVAYLQTGSCGLNGDFCTAVEVSLINESGSAADVTLIPDHEFTVTSGFGFFNGCDGAGFDCTNAGCPGAFTDPTNGLIVSCGTPNVDIAITFCD